MTNTTVKNKTGRETWFSLAREKVERTNARFLALTEGQQRQVVALEVLDAIDASAMKPTPGDYVRIELPAVIAEPIVASADRLDVLDNMELRDFMGELPKCQVCVRGALFLGTVMRHDKFLAREMNLDWYDSSGTGLGEDRPHVYAEPFDFMWYEEIHWDRNQIALMEAIFEGWLLYTFFEYLEKDRPELDVSYIEAICKAWSLKGVWGPTARITCILQNIVVCGEFDPVVFPREVDHALVIPGFAEAEAAVRALLQGE